MLTIRYHTRFKKDFKLAIKRGFDVNELQTVITHLASEEPLPAKYKDHALTDSKEYKGMRECHIQSDWLLIYKITQSELILSLVRTGTHSDLF